jgi:hypothetical protein
MGKLFEVIEHDTFLELPPHLRSRDFQHLSQKSLHGFVRGKQRVVLAKTALLDFPQEESDPRSKKGCARCGIRHFRII